MQKREIEINSNTKKGIYIHIPFCYSKCYYCDFVSFTNYNSKMEQYVNILCNEIRNTKIDDEIDTIFIGGGTPTTLKIEYIENIIKEVFNKKLVKDYEFTIECNPETVDKKYLQCLKGFGINRISFGLQSSNNDMLKKIGRVHNYEKFLESYKFAREVGFENINIDLMYNLPNQTLENWEKTLSDIIKLSPEHISAYSLIIEEDTKFYKMIENNDFDVPSEDTYVKFNEICFEKLKVAGYNKYEVSNYAKVGFECKHNLIYWELGDYYGFGLNAHSKIKDTRYSNTRDFVEYLKGVTCISQEKLTIQEIEEEFIFLGLRKTNGIYKEEYKNLFNKNFDCVYNDAIGFLEERNLIKNTNENIYVTEKGFHILDSIILELIK